MDLSKITDIRSFYKKDNTDSTMNIKKEIDLVRQTLLKHNLSTTNFDNNISSFRIENDSLSNASGSYDYKRNQVVNASSGYDLVHEIFHMASNDRSKNNEGGSIIKIHNTSVGFSLNEGITDYFTYLSSDNKYEIKYPIEVFVLNLLRRVYGDKIFEFHFLNEGEKVFELFGDKKDEIIDYLTILDKFTLSSVKLSDSIANIGSGRVSVNNINEMCDNLMESVEGIIRCLSNEDKNIEKEYFEEFKSLFNSSNESIRSLKEIIKLSNDYKDIDTLLSYMDEDIFYDFNL